MTQVRCEVKGVFVAMSDSTTVPLVVLSDGGELSPANIYRALGGSFNQ